MRYFFFIMLAAIKVWGQKADVTFTVQKPKTNEIISVRDRSAFFRDANGDDKSFIYKYIRENIKVPDSVSSGLARGTVYVEFTVLPDGQVSNVHVINRLINCGSCNDEVIRVIQSMPKWWYPALEMSKLVESKMTLPIRFSP